MELIVFIQVFSTIVIIAVGTLFYMCCRSLKFSSSSSSSVADSVVADSAIVDSVVADSAIVDSVVADSAIVDSVVADSTIVDLDADSAGADSAVADSVGADSVADSIVADSAGADSVGVDSSVADADIPPSLEKYDVFISFRGMDTRNIFTCHLHKALVEKKIDTYIDNRLKRGEEIGPTLLKEIEKSKFWVIIFSENFATSAWCLDELVHIIKCNEKRRGDFMIPIFYHTNPSDVREHRGTYAAALAQHQSIDKVKEWKEALTKAANRSGSPHPKKAGTDADLVNDVVKDIWTKLCLESSCDLRGLVGIKSRIKQIELLLGIDSPVACITVGIWGMGGIGKTTLAEAVFHSHSSNFEASCFVKDVRENSGQAGGLDRLYKTLLKEILKEEFLPTEAKVVRRRLRCTKVLIVLDDVSDSRQIEHLAGNSLQFGTGSRIIITSRDKSTLRQTVEEELIYEVKGLEPNHALQLFCSRAFKKNSLPKEDYKELVKKAVDYAGRVPSALIHLGGIFSNCKSKKDWEYAFDGCKKFPRGTTDVKALFVNWSKIQKIQERSLERADFKVMSKLIMLIGNSFQTYDLTFTASLDLPDSLCYLYWWGYPLKSLPSNFSPERLVELHMPFSKVEKLWTEDQRLVNLKVIDLYFSPNLTQVPNLSSSTKIEDINLHGCVSLVEIPWYFQHLDNLTRLDLGGCTSINDLPLMPTNIEYLNLEGCIQFGV